MSCTDLNILRTLRRPGFGAGAALIVFLTTALPIFHVQALSAVLAGDGPAETVLVWHAGAPYLPAEPLLQRSARTGIHGLDASAHDRGPGGGAEVHHGGHERLQGIACEGGPGPAPLPHLSIFCLNCSYLI